VATDTRIGETSEAACPEKDVSGAQFTRGASEHVAPKARDYAGQLALTVVREIVVSPIRADAG